MLIHSCYALGPPCPTCIANFHIFHLSSALCQLQIVSPVLGVPAPYSQNTVIGHPLEQKCGDQDCVQEMQGRSRSLQVMLGKDKFELQLTTHAHLAPATFVPHKSGRFFPTGLRKSEEAKGCSHESQKLSSGLEMALRQVLRKRHLPLEGTGQFGNWLDQRGRQTVAERFYVGNAASVRANG